MDSFMEIINSTYFSNTLYDYLLFFGCILIGVILGKSFYFLCKTRLRKLAEQSTTNIDDYLIDIIEEPLVLVIMTAGFWVGTFFLTLNASAEKLFNNITLILLAISLTWFLLRFIDVLVKVYAAPLAKQSESKLDDQLLPLIRKFLKAVIAILATMIVLSNLGYDILSLIAGLGIGGLALALASQDAVKNIIGGITIFWDKPFQIDDYIEINGSAGTVSEVGLRSTRLKSVGGTTYVLPNSQVADTMLQNYSTRKARRVVINIGLTYETKAAQMDEAIKIIEASINSIDGTRNNDVMIRFINFGAFSLDLEVVYWITKMSDWKMIIHNVNMSIKRDLDEAGIDMAFPTETHYVINQS